MYLFPFPSVSSELLGISTSMGNLMLLPVGASLELELSLALGCADAACLPMNPLRGGEKPGGTGAADD